MITCLFPFELHSLDWLALTFLQEKQSWCGHRKSASILFWHWHSITGQKPSTGPIVNLVRPIARWPQFARKAFVAFPFCTMAPARESARNWSSWWISIMVAAEIHLLTTWKKPWVFRLCGRHMLPLAGSLVTIPSTHNCSSSSYWLQQDLLISTATSSAGNISRIVWA